MPPSTTTILLISTSTSTTHAPPLQHSTLVTYTYVETPETEISMKTPSWLNAVTYPLICYDVVIVAVLCWLWVFGHLWWLRDRGEERMERRRQRGSGLEREMRRHGVV